MESARCPDRPTRAGKHVTARTLTPYCTPDAIPSPKVEKKWTGAKPDPRRNRDFSAGEPTVSGRIPWPSAEQHPAVGDAGQPV